MASYAPTHICFPIFFIPLIFVPTSDSQAKERNRFYFQLLHILIKIIFWELKFLLHCIFLLCAKAPDEAKTPKILTTKLLRGAMKRQTHSHWSRWLHPAGSTKRWRTQPTSYLSGACPAPHTTITQESVRARERVTLSLNF